MVKNLPLVSRITPIDIRILIYDIKIINYLFKNPMKNWETSDRMPKNNSKVRITFNTSKEGHLGDKNQIIR